MKTEPESKRAIETARTAIAQVDRRKLEKREHREMYDRASRALEMLEDMEREDAATAGERADRIVEGFVSSARTEDGRAQLGGYGGLIGPGFLLIGAGLATWWHWVVGLFILFPAAVLVVLFVRKRWLKKRLPAVRPAIVAQGKPDRSPTIPQLNRALSNLIRTCLSVTEITTGARTTLNHRFVPRCLSHVSSRPWFHSREAGVLSADKRTVNRLSRLRWEETRAGRPFCPQPFRIKN